MLVLWWPQLLSEQMSAIGDLEQSLLPPAVGRWGFCVQFWWWGLLAFSAQLEIAAFGELHFISHAERLVILPWFFFFIVLVYFLKDICYFKNFCETFSSFLLVLLRFTHYNILFRKIYRIVSLFIYLFVCLGGACMAMCGGQRTTCGSSLLPLRSLSWDSNSSC